MEHLMHIEGEKRNPQSKALFTLGCKSAATCNRWLLLQKIENFLIPATLQICSNQWLGSLKKPKAESWKNVSRILRRGSVVLEPSLSTSFFEALYVFSTLQSDVLYIFPHAHPLWDSKACLLGYGTKIITTEPEIIKIIIVILDEDISM